MRTAIIAAGAACLTLAGCGGSALMAAKTSHAPVSAAHTTTSPIAAWANTVQGDFQLVANDTSAIATAANSQDPTGLATACGALKADVVRFEADPAAPDAELRADIARAMDAYSTAASQCLAGDYTASGDSLQSGNQYADAATARITALSSH